MHRVWQNKQTVTGFDWMTNWRHHYTKRVANDTDGLPQRLIVRDNVTDERINEESDVRIVKIFATILNNLHASNGPCTVPFSWSLQSTTLIIQYIPKRHEILHLRGRRVPGATRILGTKWETGRRKQTPNGKGIVSISSNLDKIKIIRGGRSSVVSIKITNKKDGQFAYGRIWKSIFLNACTATSVKFVIFDVQ